MAESKPRKSSPGHGGYRPGSGRKPKTEQNDAYTVLAKAKAKRESYAAQLAELEYKKAVGEVISADIVLAQWQEMFSNVRARLLSLPAHLASVCANVSHDEVEKKATDLVREALQELSDNGRH